MYMRRGPALTASFLLLLLATSDAFAQNTVAIDGAFADWSDEFCRPDTVCADFSGQADAKGACIASNFAATNPSPATTAYLRFDFSVTGLAGANTADGCWLVDSNQSGTVDRALCFSLSGNPLTLQQTRFFTCNDSSATTCGAAAEVPSSSVCGINAALATGQHLLVCGGDTADTAVECSSTLTDLGWTSGEIVLLRGCTYNSAQPNSNPSDCIVDGASPFIINPTTGGNTPVTLESMSIE
jgi:hypothetical protein